MSYTQNSEVVPDHSMIAVDHQRRCNLISKNIDENSKCVSQPKKNKDTVKILTEKQVVETSRPEIPVVVNTPLEVKIAHKLPPVFDFENEIKKNDDFKKTFMKSLQPPRIEVASDFVNL